MTMAPSTSRPKSIAPSDIRLPVTLQLHHAEHARSPIDSGMASAAISAPRKAPQRQEEDDATSTAPSARLMATVFSIRSMNSARS